LAAVDHDLRAVGGKGLGNSAADAFGGTGNQRAKSGKINLHAITSLVICRQAARMMVVPGSRHRHNDTGSM
jgi:hypothetical protein